MTDTEKRLAQVSEAASLAARLLDSANYIMQDVQEDYFERYNPAQEDDAAAIRFEFSRNRAMIFAISRLLIDAEDALGEAGIAR